MSPKSVKRDGTPKKRWSAAERAERGHIPRRRGGLPRNRSEEFAGRERRSDAPDSRAPKATDQRDARPARKSHTRPDRAEWPSRSARDNSKRGFTRSTPEARDSRGFSNARTRDDRPDRGQRPERTDRYESREQRPRFERPATADRYERRDRPDRTVRPDRTDRPDRTVRPDRAARPDRFERTDRPERRTEPPRTERYERRSEPPRTERYERRSEPQRFDRTDRPERGDRFERRDRPERGDRFERRDRPERVQRPEPIERHQAEPIELESAPEADGASHSGDFAALGLPASLVSALRADGITSPFPIQAAAIPDALAGRDVLGRGQTGSGKTLAFGLPMIATLAGGTSSAPRAIVLVPTRELAMQVHDVLTPLAKTAGLSVVLVAGGMSYTPQLRAFQRGVDIVVATPGRLIDLMDQGAADLTRVEIAVLDEADHMADLGFMPDVTTILDTVPSGGQRLLFSATLDGAVDRVVRTYLDNPVTHQVNSGQASVSTMAHHLVHVAPKDKAQVTAEIAGRPGRTLIFVRTQRGADRVAEQLRAAGVLAGALHGGLAQGARTRILSVFKDGSLPVLVATDVAARGIHVDEVGLVLQVDPPGGPKEYLHRAGRTARAGGIGTVVTLVLPHQRRELSRLTGQAGVRAVELPGQPGDRVLVEATGAQIIESGPVSESVYERLIAPPPARRRSAADRPYGKSGGHGRGRNEQKPFHRGPRRDR